MKSSADSPQKARAADLRYATVTFVALVTFHVIHVSGGSYDRAVAGGLTCMGCAGGQPAQVHHWGQQRRPLCP